MRSAQGSTTFKGWGRCRVSPPPTPLPQRRMRRGVWAFTLQALPRNLVPSNLHQCEDCTLMGRGGEQRLSVSIRLSTRQRRVFPGSGDVTKSLSTAASPALQRTDHTPRVPGTKHEPVRVRVTGVSVWKG